MFHFLKRLFAIFPIKQRAVTRLDFQEAFYQELKRHWPELKRSDGAARDWQDPHAPFGCPGYDWSLEAARELARDYAQQYGEALK